MPKICYQDKNFRRSTLEQIAIANQIIEEYDAQGFDLTLRQLYYQMVARDMIPNNQKEYDRLGRTINDARMAGLIDWEHIVDRTRNVRSNGHWSSPAGIMHGAAQSYQIDKWATQPNRVEVWVEKDAMVGVIESICSPLDVAFFSCRGYTSQSEMWAAAQRVKGHISKGQTVIILHLGDHDPSGIDMTRDIVNRLETFMGGLEVNRLALNYNQVEEHRPPPNFAKESDSRFRAYHAQFGPSSWELDALNPTVVRDIIVPAVEQFRDPDLWRQAQELEAEQRALLEAAADSWDDVTDFLSDIGLTNFDTNGGVEL
ncbi:MAG: hypothetical protein H6641_15700 [Caldilineaceae bacterium]|nr:hypothetical protein [Caldilineaceae bacterium]